MGKTLGAMLALGGLTLAGCDSPGEVELAQREYNGKVTIRFVQEVRWGDDKYRLEVRDSVGTVLGYMTTIGTSGQVLLTPDKVYDLNEKGVRLSGVD